MSKLDEEKITRRLDESKGIELRKIRVLLEKVQQQMKEFEGLADKVSDLAIDVEAVCDKVDYGDPEGTWAERMHEITDDIVLEKLNVAEAKELGELLGVCTISSDPQLNFLTEWANDIYEFLSEDDDEANCVKIRTKFGEDAKKLIMEFRDSLRTLKKNYEQESKKAGC